MLCDKGTAASNRRDGALCHSLLPTMILFAFDQTTSMIAGIPANLE